MAEELLGLAYLKNKLALKKIRVDLRYRYRGTWIPHDGRPNARSYGKRGG